MIGCFLTQLIVISLHNIRADEMKAAAIPDDTTTEETTHHPIKNQSVIFQWENIVRNDSFMLFLSSFLVLFSSLITLYAIQFGPLALLIVFSMTTSIYATLKVFVHPVFISFILLLLQIGIWYFNYTSGSLIPLLLFSQQSSNPHYPIISDISFFIELSTILLFFIFLYHIFYYFYFTLNSKNTEIQFGVLLILLFDLLFLFYFSLKLSSFTLFFFSLFGITIFLFQMLSLGVFLNIFLNLSFVYLIHIIYTADNLFIYFNYFKVITNFIFGPFGVLLCTLYTIFIRINDPGEKNFVAFILFATNVLLLYLAKKLNNMSMFFVGLADIAIYVLWIGMRRLKGHGEFLIFLVFVSAGILGIVLNYQL